MDLPCPFPDQCLLPIGLDLERLLLYTVLVCSGCHRLDGLNNRRLYLTVLEAVKFKIKVLADSVLGEDPPPGLQISALSL